MKMGKFHTPYMPNDGHGPGKKLPEKLHRWLCTLSGGTWPVRTLLDCISEMTFEEEMCYSGIDSGDYIQIVASIGDYPKHNWMGIKYDEVQDN